MRSTETERISEWKLPNKSQIVPRHDKSSDAAGDIISGLLITRPLFSLQRESPSHQSFLLNVEDHITFYNDFHLI